MHPSPAYVPFAFFAQLPNAASPVGTNVRFAVVGSARSATPLACTITMSFPTPFGNAVTGAALTLGRLLMHATVRPAFGDVSLASWMSNVVFVPTIAGLLAMPGSCTVASAPMATHPAQRGGGA